MCPTTFNIKILNGKFQMYKKRVEHASMLFRNIFSLRLLKTGKVRKT